MRILLVCCAALALSVGVATATAGGGNSENAKKCQKDGWQNWVRSDGTAFKNQGECVSYAAQGGTLTPPKPQSQIDCEAADGVYAAGDGQWFCLNFLNGAAGALGADCLAELPGNHVLPAIPDAGTGRTSFLGCLPPSPV
jgi:hypothetical protein